MTATAGDRVRAMVSVAVPPALAFEIFTTEIDLWWRRGPARRSAAGEQALIAIEPREGGRVFEQHGDTLVHEIGRVLAWEPPQRLVFEWRASNFAPVERTEVEVLFEAVPEGTRVTVTHTGWAALRPDHPVRHGQPVPAFVAGRGRWWGALLTAYRLRARSREIRG